MIFAAAAPCSPDRTPSNPPRFSHDPQPQADGRPSCCIHCSHRMPAICGEAARRRQPWSPTLRTGQEPDHAPCWKPERAFLAVPPASAWDAGSSPPSRCRWWESPEHPWVSHPKGSAPSARRLCRAHTGMSPLGHGQGISWCGLRRVRISSTLMPGNPFLRRWSMLSCERPQSDPRFALFR